MFASSNLTGGASLFGASPSATATAQAGDASAANAAATKLDQFKNTAAQTLLSDWEHRLKKQANDFQKYLSAMSSFDKDLFQFIGSLETVQAEQQHIELKQQTIIKSLEEVEGQQNKLVDALTKMESALSEKIPISIKPNQVAGDSRTLQVSLAEIEELADVLSAEVETTKKQAYSNGLAQLLDMLTIYQRHVSQTNEQLRSIKQVLSLLESGSQIHNPRI